MGILGRSFDDTTVMERLRLLWQHIVERIVRSPMLAVVGQRWLLSVLVRGLRLIMARQPDYQPINLREITHAFSRPPAFRAHALEVIADLDDPSRGFNATLSVLRRDLPFDVFLMLAAERTLVYHGVCNPGPMLDALSELQRNGCTWFRPSALYVAFHALHRAPTLNPTWWDMFVRMARETIGGSRAAFQTDCGTYSLGPHVAWAEIIAQRFRDSGRASFIPDFFAQAMAAGDFDFARRVLGACDILCLAYNQALLALDGLRGALRVGGVPGPGPLRDLVVETLANIRFHEEDAVDRLLDEFGDADLGRRVEAAPPTIKAADLPTWIDDFMNHSLVHSDTFRGEIAALLRRMAAAPDVTRLFRCVLTWGTNYIGGGRVHVES
jgi:hypothetical protein